MKWYHIEIYIKDLFGEFGLKGGELRLFD